VPIGRVRLRTSRKAPLDGVGNRHDGRGAPRPARIAWIVAYGATIRAAGRWEHDALVAGRVATAGEEIVEGGAQTGHRLGRDALPAPGGAARGGPGGRQDRGVHDPMQAGLDGGLVGLADRVEHVADLVRPTALRREVGEGLWAKPRAGRLPRRVGERGPNPAPTGQAVDAEHLETLAGQPAADQVADELLPLRRALGGRQTQVDALLLAVRAQAERDQHGPRQRAGAGLALEHHAIQDEHPVLILERPALEGGHGALELPGHARSPSPG